jgi:hypothetical protein
VTSIRTSGDHGYMVGPEVLWAWFLHTNVMARALGLWPYKDVFQTAATSATRDVEALLAALSAGPVGIGDAIGDADPEIVRRTCRADGALVRPDVPIAALDRAAFAAPVWSGEPLVAATHTQHSAGRWGYVLTCNVATDQQAHAARVALTDLGEDGPGTDSVALYDWRSGGIEVLPGDGAYDVELEPTGWDYRIAAPVLAGGLAVVGDPGLYAAAGDARIADVAVDGGDVVVTVLGAGELVHIVGWASAPISARGWAPASGATEVATTYDADHGSWRVAVAVGEAGWAKVRIRRLPDAPMGVLGRT